MCYKLCITCANMCLKYVLSVALSDHPINHDYFQASRWLMVAIMTMMSVTC